MVGCGRRCVSVGRTVLCSSSFWLFSFFCLGGLIGSKRFFIKVGGVFVALYAYVLFVFVWVVQPSMTECVQSLLSSSFATTTPNNPASLSFISSPRHAFNLMFSTFSVTILTNSSHFSLTARFCRAASDSTVDPPCSATTLSSARPFAPCSAAVVSTCFFVFSLLLVGVFLRTTGAGTEMSFLAAVLEMSGSVSFASRELCFFRSIFSLPASDTDQ